MWTAIAIISHISYLFMWIWVTVRLFSPKGELRRNLDNQQYNNNTAKLMMAAGVVSIIAGIASYNTSSGDPSVVGLCVYLIFGFAVIISALVLYFFQEQYYTTVEHNDEMTDLMDKSRGWVDQISSAFGDVAAIASANGSDVRKYLGIIEIAEKVNNDWERYFVSDISVNPLDPNYCPDGISQQDYDKFKKFMAAF